MSPTHETEAISDREIVLTRTIEASRRIVFEACTAPDHLARWWGPDGFSITTHQFEFRPGGNWIFTMHGPEGIDYPNHVEWLEITPPELIRLRHGESADDPNAFEATVALAERGPYTELTQRAVFQTVAQREQAVREFGAVEAGNQTLRRLAAYAATITDEA